MLKSTATVIAPAITALFNLSLTQGKLPKDWKTARVVPIFKSKEKSVSTNYRPISLLSILSKILEKHVKDYLYDCLQILSPISIHQWGFSRGKSTTGALLTATHAWHQALEVGHDVCCVFLDLSKAFDTVPHLPLLDRLISIGINPYVINWIHDYLCQRSQYVVVDGERSDVAKVISGVPQGSVLGPLLFNIYMDELTQLPLQDGTSLLLYADDILLYRKIRDLEDYHILQEDISTLEGWFLHSHLKLNVTKSKHMIITRKHALNQPEFQLQICGEPIERVPVYKYLGVWLSENLTWKTHIEHISKKAKIQTGMVYRRFYGHSTPDCLLQLYLSFVRPHLEYAAPVWDPHCSSQVTVLENIQKLALRMAYKAWKEQYTTLLERSKLPLLTDRRKMLKICLLYRILNGESYFPDAPLVFRNPDPRLRNTDPSLLCLPFIRTTAYMNSFFPHAISVWNSLPSIVRLAPSTLNLNTVFCCSYLACNPH